MNLVELKAAAANPPSISESVNVQITARDFGHTTDGTPYFEITIADSSASEKVRLWENSPAYRTLFDFPQMGKGTAIQMTGRWRVHSRYGLQVDESSFRALDPDEMMVLYAGGEAFTKQNDADWWYVRQLFEAVAHPDNPMTSLGVVCIRLMDGLNDSFRRAAGAHGAHHARRGGLLAHTSSMLKVAVALCRDHVTFYPEVTPEILYAGILFHDIGKIFETDYEKCGFAMEPTLRGTLLGHISLGFSLLFQLWKDVCGEEDELLRDHVAHLILSHHGQKDWGSPVEPALPEAILLHQIDMMDAGIEKLRNAYRAGTPECLGAVKAVYPMKGAVGLPYNTSAAFTRQYITAALWVWERTGGSEDSQSNEVKFVEALRAEGIITEIKPLKELPRSVLETAINRWGDLRMHCKGLPRIPHGGQ